MSRPLSNKCPKCGGFMYDATAADVGGLEGISYQHCNACGYTRAKRGRRPTKRELLKALKFK